jgi:hypothetical protein
MTGAVLQSFAERSAHSFTELREFRGKPGGMRNGCQQIRTG